MIILSPLRRRITYVAIFEILAVIFAALLLSLLSDKAPAENLPVAVASSVVAVVWNFIYNTLFERWERRNNIRQRSIMLRTAHACGFEGGLIVIFIPLFMWWYRVGPLTALMMEAALLIFFLIYTFFFTLAFDQIFPRTD